MHNCVLQSEDEPVTAADMSKALPVQQQTTVFTGEPGEHVGYVPDTDYLAEGDAITAAGLANFLQRPVRIANFTWNESDAVGQKTSIYPWQLYFNDASIKYKMNNFAFLRCNLKLKIIVNASPFYYGWMKACWQPLSNFTTSTIVASAGSQALISFSQRPNVDIVPAANAGGEMTLPFFWQRNWLRVSKAQDFTDMGQLTFQIYSALSSANGVTGQGCTVQVYAWAEDVKLSGPTLGLALQSDEYGMGPVSGPASTVARIAGMIKGVPIIGKFATATEMGANAISGIAKLFGFSNVPVIEPAQPYRQLPFPPFASPEIGYPVEKLTLDPKNELSIDPTSVGLPGHDELAIEGIVTRQSYLTSATWSTATAVDTLIFASKVTPYMFDNDAAAVNKLYFTPMGMVANHFQNWRGDIIFTFNFVASKYHRGRVRISYDPYSTSVMTTGDTGSAVYNTIVDLEEDTVAEVRVPYQQALAWLRVDATNTVAGVPYILSGSSLILDDTTTNGIISMKVLTLLTAPAATAPVNILVSVRAAENLEFANPISYGSGLSMFAMQSEDLTMSEVPKGVELMQVPASPEMFLDRYRVNFGECVKSLRQILRRTNYSDTFTGTASISDMTTMFNRHSRFPMMYGYDPAGPHQAKGVTATGTTFQFNWVSQTPYSMIAPCYIGQKGSVFWYYNVESPALPNALWANRINQRSVTAYSLGQNGANYTTNSQTAFLYSTLGGNTTTGGCALTNPVTQSGLAVGVPNYTQFKFESTSPTAITAPVTSVGNSNYDGTNYEFVQVNVGCGGNAEPKPEHTRVHKYFGVGTDFSLYFFLNVPTFYRYTGVPVPV